MYAITRLWNVIRGSRLDSELRQELVASVPHVPILLKYSTVHEQYGLIRIDRHQSLWRVAEIQVHRPRSR